MQTALFVLLLRFSGRNLDAAKVLRSHPRHANKIPSQRELSGEKEALYLGVVVYQRLTAVPVQEYASIGDSAPLHL